MLVIGDLSDDLLARVFAEPCELVVDVDKVAVKVGDRQRVQDRVENLAQVGFAVDESLYRRHQVADVARNRQAAQLAIELEQHPRNQARNEVSVFGVKIGTQVPNSPVAGQGRRKVVRFVTARPYADLPMSLAQHLFPAKAGGA